jgi:hypothetical protein
MMGQEVGMVRVSYVGASGLLASRNDGFYFQIVKI